MSSIRPDDLYDIHRCPRCGQNTFFDHKYFYNLGIQMESRVDRFCTTCGMKEFEWPPGSS